MNLTETEKAFLRECRMNPVWGDIVAKIADELTGLPRYKRNGEDPAKQERDWVFASGVDLARQTLVKILTDG